MSTPGVSNCFVFKSRLQEYAQKVGLSTPVYETIKEGPSHEPSFRSTVIVNDVRYDSLPGFYNRKAAEQSAAEVALHELAKSGETNESVSQPVHETGLCKNLLQEYAQKMNYAIPTYECRRDETTGRVVHFYCTVEIGGIQYIGAAAKTKKEAEIKAARTALLAIQSSDSEIDKKPMVNSHLTVIPCKKKGTELSTTTEQAAKSLKAKKAHFKTKQRKKHRAKKGKGSEVENTGRLDVNLDDRARSNSHLPDDASVLEEASEKFKGGRSDSSVNGGERSEVANLDHTFQNGQQPVSNFIQTENINPDIKASSMSHVYDITTLNKEEVGPDS